MSLHKAVKSKNLNVVQLFVVCNVNLLLQNKNKQLSINLAYVANIVDFLVST